MSTDNIVPKITLINKGVAQFEAYVNTYVVSKNEYRMADGSYRHELYYLSMFGPRGSGSTINAIFSGLVSQPALRDLSIEGLGPVSLMHRSERIRKSGFAPPWSCDFTEFGPDRALHAVVECKAMTLWDPQHNAISRRRSSSGQKGKHRDSQQKAPARGKREGGSISSQAGDMTEEVAQMHERHPIFLMLVPGAANRNTVLDAKDPQAEVEAEKWLQQLHIAYLDKRCPWPLIDDWAEFLWKRANSQGTREIEQLSVWCYKPALVAGSSEELQEADQDKSSSESSPVDERSDADEQEGDSVLVDVPPLVATERVLPVFANAYLCYPDMVKMITDLSLHVGSTQQLAAVMDDALATGKGRSDIPKREDIAA
jgi:hypothetical protein